MKLLVGSKNTGKIDAVKESFEKSFQKTFTIRFNDDFGSRFTIPVKSTIAYTDN